MQITNQHGFQYKYTIKEFISIRDRDHISDRSLMITKTVSSSWSKPGCSDRLIYLKTFQNWQKTIDSLTIDSLLDAFDVGLETADVGSQTVDLRFQSIEAGLDLFRNRVDSWIRLIQIITQFEQHVTCVVQTRQWQRLTCALCAKEVRMKWHDVDISLNKTYATEPRNNECRRISANFICYKKKKRYFLKRSVLQPDVEVMLALNVLNIIEGTRKTKMTSILLHFIICLYHDW